MPLPWSLVPMLKPPQLHNPRKISQPPVLMLMKQTNLFRFRILLAILLPLLRSPATISGDVGDSISTDASALLSLKSIMASNHVLDTNWTEGPPPEVCYWMGVSCISNPNKRVHSLDLPGMGLQGHIPPQLGNLSALVRLDLSNNSLERDLPVEIWSLSALKFLNLSKNNLSGEIPVEAGKLKSLTNLSLANNAFTGPIPKNIKDLENLEFLDLRFNNLSGEFPGDSLESLWKGNLNHLNVSHNNLTGKVPCGGNRMEKFPEDAFKWNYHLDCDCPFLYSATRTFLFTCVFMGMAIGLLLLGFAFVVLKNVQDSVNSYKVLHEATNGFHEDNKLLPEGRFGRVYKGSLSLPNSRNDGKAVAQKEFVAEGRFGRVYKGSLSLPNLRNDGKGVAQEEVVAEGRFGRVYKGSLSLPNLRNDGKGVAQEEVVAVKVFNLEKIELKNFEAESKRLRWMGGHRNLTPVIGSCSLTSLAMVMGGGPYSEFKALVMKFMPNGSLEGCLHSETCSMDINRRLEIMIGVASGLEYLHEKGLFHGDLKPSNVLLDEEMVAYLSDFGITKSEKTKTKQPTSDEQQPAPGYSDPEYDPKTPAKSDIYSFGITLMETFTRKKPTDKMFSSEWSLRDWIKEQRSNVIEVVDAKLIREGKEKFETKLECVSSVLEVALKCTKKFDAERRLEDIELTVKKRTQDIELAIEKRTEDMKVVVNELKKIQDKLFPSTSVSSSRGYQSYGEGAQENTS